MSYSFIETCRCFKSYYGSLDKGISYHGTLCARCVTTDDEGCPGVTDKQPITAMSTQRVSPYNEKLSES